MNDPFPPAPKSIGLSSDHAPGNITLVNPGMTDKDMALDLRNRLTIAMLPVVEIMEEARRAGLQLGFNIGPDAFGIVRLQGVTVVKPL